MRSIHEKAKEMCMRRSWSYIVFISFQSWSNGTMQRSSYNTRVNYHPCGERYVIVIEMLISGTNQIRSI